MPDPDARDLAHAYFDHRLDETGLRSLERRLADDPAFRSWFTDQCRQEVALGAVVRLHQRARMVATGGPRRRHRPRPKPGFTWAMAAGFAALVALGALIGGQRTWFRNQPTAEILAAAEHTGLPGSPSKHLAVGDGLMIGEELAFATSAQLLHHPSGAHLLLTGPGRCQVTADGLRLSAGKAEAQVPPQHGGSFRILTPHVQVTVIGTRFTVETGPERTTVSVAEGIVEVATSSGQRRLRAGESLPWPPLPAHPPPPSGTPQPTSPRTGGALVLLDVLSDQRIHGGDPLENGTRIPFSTVASVPVALQAVVAEGCKSVRFRITGPDGKDLESGFEATPPFVYPGDDGGRIRPEWRLRVGTYQVAVQEFSDASGLVRSGRERVVTFVVE